MLQQNLKNLKRLFLEPDLKTLLAQFSALTIQLKDTEANDRVGWREIVHERDTPEVLGSVSRKKAENPPSLASAMD
jgi:hypothetical protein